MMQIMKIEQAIHALLQVIAAKSGDSETPERLDYLALLGDLTRFYRQVWGHTLDWPYEQMLGAVRTTADVLSVAAIDADSRMLSQAAARIAERAAELSGESRYMAIYAAFLRKSGQVGQARELCNTLRSRHPDSQQVLSELFMCVVAERFWSRDYYDLLGELHARFRPRSYLEIGVATGKSLALVRHATRALGVDPATAESARLIYHSPENVPQLYRMTSDEFFEQRDIRQELGRDSFDLAFIDGLHHFDQVLRDFINLEQYAGPDSVVLIHDCLPVDPQVATRERSTAFWTGDVWRIIPCLQAVRPDLEIITLPLAPAGLAVVRRLDPASRVLTRHYDGIVAQFEQLALPADWDERCRLLAVEQDETAFEAGRIAPAGGWS